MKKQVLNTLLYMLITLILSFILSMIITKLYNFAFFESFFWIGIGIVAIGGMSSITGNASGSRLYSGITDGQYHSFANIESLQIERKLTNYYTNFKKHAVFDPKTSGFGVILAGLILVIIGYHFGQ